MDRKTVKHSSVVLCEMMQPQQANIAGNIHGGVIMKLIDNAAGVVCFKHARTNVVTASIDRLSFFNPVFVGDLITLKASLNMAGTSSMEVGVRVETENIFSGDIKHVASAYLTFVALDGNGKPTKVPALLLETDEEKRRNEEALDRKRIRTLERIKEEEHQRRQEVT
ncbi:acyl-CoA thioesterase [bacterium]|nr:acyl-CoA thioesterase [bacterium]